MIKPGIHEISADAYHSDPCPQPSLSASIAHVLLSQSPQHAMWAHPSLSPAFEREESEAFDLGTAAHAYLLQGDTSAVLVHEKDWKKKDAQEQRDAARADGRIPILAHKWADVLAMAAALREQLANHAAPIPFTNGRAEEALIWEEDGIWCRARLDWLHQDGRYIDDYKTSGGSVHPDAWTRGPLFANGSDLQAAFYLRGVSVLLEQDATFRFVCQENYAPYAAVVIGLGPDVLTLAEKKRRRAVALWRACLETGVWPGYPTDVCTAELPPWAEASWTAREIHEEDAMRRRGVVDDGRPIGQLLVEGT